MNKHTINLKNRSTRRGFTLMELMFAISILGVGMIAIASIFPVASLIQRETADDTMSQQVKGNIRALIESRGVSLSDMSTQHNPFIERQGEILPALVPFESKILGLDGDGTDKNVYWSLADRTFPAVVEDPRERTHVWVPMLLKNRSASKVYVFIMRVSRDYRYDRFGAESDWANYKDGEDRVLGKSTNRIPGVKRFKVSQVKVQRVTNPPISNTFFRLNSHGGAIQLGSKVVSNTGKIWTVTLVNQEPTSATATTLRYKKDWVRVSGTLSDTEAGKIKELWTGVAPPSETDGSVIERPNPLIDIMVVGLESFKQHKLTAPAPAVTP